MLKQLQLASGGDTMLGRCNYQDEIEFTPQFIMMLQCNEFKRVEPVDALESCEQFYCKSKFVMDKIDTDILRRPAEFLYPECESWVMDLAMEAHLNSLKSPVVEEPMAEENQTGNFFIGGGGGDNSTGSSGTGGKGGGGLGGDNNAGGNAISNTGSGGGGGGGGGNRGGDGGIVILRYKYTRTQL